MLTLYSFGPAANSLKPLLVLYEKGLIFTPHFFDPRRFEHHESWFTAINPRGQVPALDHDGAIITESTVICEYLADAFPDAPPLRPADAVGRARMREWTKWVDEYFCWCVSTIGWERMIGPLARSLSDADFEQRVAAIPVAEQQAKWRAARAGFAPELLDEEMRKVRHSVARLETRLAESPWLAGDDYTLADICNFAIANRLPQGFPEFVNAAATPHLLAWIDRINARPAAIAMFARSASEMTPSHPAPTAP